MMSCCTRDNVDESVVAPVTEGSDAVTSVPENVTPCDVRIPTGSCIPSSSSMLPFSFADVFWTIWSPDLQMFHLNHPSYRINL